MKPIIQYAALPVAFRAERLSVLLITSRGTGRWIIPKGGPEKGVTAWDQAAREAYEEAGVIGRIDPDPLGTFRYIRRRSAGKSAAFILDVYLLAVERELEDWPEKGQRKRRWVSPGRAAFLVGRPPLARLLLRLGTLRRMIGFTADWPPSGGRTGSGGPGAGPPGRR
jgi:8-oxo-dGTP pyrophosphatase MutT (NUDIX family)